MKEKFNSYDYIGVIAPGSIVCIAATFVFDDVGHLISGDGVTIGGFGIFVILSFVVGHLLQAVGNFIEVVLWRIFGGMPTEWVRKTDQNILAKIQIDKLNEKLKKKYEGLDDIQNIDDETWRSITRELYASVQVRGNVERIDSFNRTYGLLRGMGAAFLVSAVSAVWFCGLSDLDVLVSLLLLMLIAIYRMYRFAIHYSRELFIQYLSDD